MASSTLLSTLVADPNAANAIAAIASAVSAFFALGVSAMALYVAHATLKHQQKHNVLSVKPIPIVTVADFEDAIRVKIRNHGSGPMMLKGVKVKKGTDQRETILGWMPDLPQGVGWKNYAGPIANRSLLPGSEIMLLELNGDKNAQVFIDARNQVRSVLAQLSVVIDYTDMYETKFSNYSKGLEWFGGQCKK